MAQTRTKKRSASRSNTAGRSTKRHYTKKRNMSHHRRRNPAGLGRPIDWIKGGVGVLGGVVATRALPQLAGATNTGGIGYLMNAGVAIGAAWATHAFTKDTVLTAAVAAGGFAALIARVISDMTPYGQYLSLSGVGDYMAWNFNQPQRAVGPNQSMIDTTWMGGAAVPTIAGGSGADSSANC